jgi:hypothetical protein
VNNTTLQIIKVTLQGDQTVTPTQRAQILALLRNGEVEKQTITEPFRVLKRGEIAKRCSRTTRWVDRLAAQGLLSKVTLPGRKRACGFRESDVIALINSGVAPQTIKEVA